MAHPLFTPHGGYRTLDTFMFSTIIYYGTVAFCRTYIQGGRQVEQMVQAARSGRQNIAEGSERSATSTHTEIQLTDVACASLAELQLDYYTGAQQGQGRGARHARLSQMRRADAHAHGQKGFPDGRDVLGLLEVPRL